MRPHGVVVVFVLTHQVLEMPLAKHHKLVQTLVLDRLKESFRECIQIGDLNDCRFFRIPSPLNNQSDFVPGGAHHRFDPAALSLITRPKSGSDVGSCVPGIS